MINVYPKYQNLDMYILLLIYFYYKIVNFVRVFLHRRGHQCNVLRFSSIKLFIFVKKYLLMIIKSVRHDKRYLAYQK